jgi:O-acetyl-ADP-ribose deacetylase (regulator of RNase III)
VPPILYEAVREALAELARFARSEGASVHMPRIGCGLAGGTWDRIEPLICQTLVATGVETVVYDLPAGSHDRARQAKRRGAVPRRNSKSAEDVQ